MNTQKTIRPEGQIPHAADNIHPTAIIMRGAAIAPSAHIGPFCVIGANATIGENTILKSHVVIDGYTTLGDNNVVFPFASLGQPPQDLKHDGEITRLTIGDNNEIREYVTMHPGTADDLAETRIGSRNLIMTMAHIAHDCIVGDDCILANGATLAGHVSLADKVRIGGLTAIAQFVRLGHGAFVGGHCGVDRDIPPYGKVTSQIDSLGGANVVGLRRSGLSNDDIRSLSGTFAQLFDDSRNKPLRELAAELLQEANLTSYQQQVLNFVVEGSRKRVGA